MSSADAQRIGGNVAWQGKQTDGRAGILCSLTCRNEPGEAIVANGILLKMLERLFGSLMNGPGLNCRPHSSRQRVDLSQFSRFQDVTAEELIERLLGEERRVRVTNRVKRPVRMEGPKESPIELTEGERREGRQWSDQQTVFGKLRTIAEDARTYEQDTGVQVLNIGFPLLSMPPGAGGKGGRRGATSRRIVAPIAFIPVTLEVKTGGTTTVEIACRGEGVDLVRPNIALMAWLEQQTGKKTPELFDDQEAEDPWREIRELVRHVAGALSLEVPAVFSKGAIDELKIVAAPKAQDEEEAGEIVMAGVLGLYPMANEGLLRDTQALAGEEKITGPLRSFLSVNVEKGAGESEHPKEMEQRLRQFADERLVTQADPCQSRAALLARTADGLVIHGPPGTGKSQTITNIIGDHLARGQRVLMVCDKRTALDVVAHRLSHLGFGPLVALVHDPRRDQRDLYKAIRERLEGLPDVRTNAGAARELEKIDQELQGLHGDLMAYWQSLMGGGVEEGGAGSFHDLMGQWLGIHTEEGLQVEWDVFKDVTLEDGRGKERLLREVFDRGLAARYPVNAWVGAVGIALSDFLIRPMSDFVGMMEECLAAARVAEAAVDHEMPELGPEDLGEQGRLRLEVADRLERLLGLEEARITAHWAHADKRRLKKAREEIEQTLNVFTRIFEHERLDAELAVIAKQKLCDFEDLRIRFSKLQLYLDVCRNWYSVFCFKQKRLARQALEPLGLRLTATDAERAWHFFRGLWGRRGIHHCLTQWLGEEATPTLPDDEALSRAMQAHVDAVALMSRLRDEPKHAALAELVSAALATPSRGAGTVQALRKSAARADALRNTEEKLRAMKLLTEEWLQQFDTTTRRGDDAGAMLEKLTGDLFALEQVIRIRDGLTTLPDGMQTAVSALLKQGAEPDAGIAAVDKALLAAEISRRMRNDPVLQSMDGQRLKSAFDRYRKLDAHKRAVVCQVALHLWVAKQKERLLASTLSRLSTLGADLRRRLTLRGERAMRLRQVIDVGSSIEGGDPLWDMCPVWMASPETVAQLFPREALFDVVIFDEASQCRLEEALPVLTRGKRIVVAGDPKQLPPTRFFESTVAVSEDEEAEGEQGLFEQQQGEVEDLLTAALNLPIENAYLDVHYRSRNSDLISFSNDQFYNHRLQAIPAHPANMTRFSPLTLYRADGTYEERKNEKEAEQVCKIVHDLLRRAQPPSIGIACFNLVQRDLIVDKLDTMAAQDSDFSTRLVTARGRKGAGSFEGLFVKNLENVQGDERDHMIISTTYGPTKEGKFFQRFGPLGRAGGGRRLNVLITRAREEVHLVTSIPREIYTSLPPIPLDQAPGGAWLLYAYLQFAERLGALYADVGKQSDGGLPVVTQEVKVREQKSSLPSSFSEQLAETLLRTRRMGSQVHWGNDGFCVDVAIAHPQRSQDVTIGVLCDGSRYLKAADPVEWDAFRTAVHESQGWKLHRVWTPQFFRDAQGHLDTISEEVRRYLAEEHPRDALGVVPEPA